MTEPKLTILLDEATIQTRVEELAAEISTTYEGEGELVLVGVLKGAFVFLADLSRTLSIPRRIEFMAVSSYESGDVSSGTVRMVMDLRESIENKHVLIVEDIVDTGRTLRYLTDLLKARNPASVRTCAFVRKPDRIVVESPLDFLGFDLPDVWVVGYGLDYDEQYRTLPYVASIEFSQGTDS